MSKRRRKKPIIIIREAPYRYERPQIHGVIMHDDETGPWCPTLTTSSYALGLILGAPFLVGGLLWLISLL